MLVAMSWRRYGPRCPGQSRRCQVQLSGILLFFRSLVGLFSRLIAWRAPEKECHQGTLSEKQQQQQDKTITASPAALRKDPPSFCCHYSTGPNHWRKAFFPPCHSHLRRNDRQSTVICDVFLYLIKEPDCVRFSSAASSSTFEASSAFSAGLALGGLPKKNTVKELY